MSAARETKVKWTKAQRAAIEHVGGDLLVSAAAGSGKTAVLAERCARLVAEGGCGVEELLVLTFTDAAAGEMRTRIAEAIGEKLEATGDGEQRRRLSKQAAMVERASISTLHAFCGRILRQYFHGAGIDPAFEVLDGDEADLLRQEVLSDVLARWHRGVGAGAGEAARANFGEFLEAYGQGRDSTVGALVEKVYDMLASSAEPAGWKRAALEAYGAGRRELLGQFARQTVGHRVRMIGDAAERACVEVERAVGAGQMLMELGKFRQRAGEVRDMLEKRGWAAWDEARSLALDRERVSIKTVKEIGDFEAIKKRTWEKLKEAWRAACQELFAADAVTVEGDLAATEIHVRTLLALVEEFSADYAAAKRRQNCLDFSDLERMALDLLTAKGSVAAGELRKRYQHLLVDEFQDINPLQAALLEAVRSTERFAGGNLFVVGDVKQSIYGFRLADPNLFLAREEAAKRAGGEAYVMLAANFRSQPALLAIMNGVFEKLLTRAVAGLDYRDGHALEPPEEPLAVPRDLQGLVPFTGAPAEVHLVAMEGAETEGEEGEGGEGGEAEAGEEDGGGKEAEERPSAVEAEAERVAARIKGLMAEGRGIVRRDGTIAALRHRDVVILLRSMKNRALVFARALADAGVPVHADLSTGYFEAAEVRDVLAVLRVLDNPLQDIELATALLSPYGRFSFDDLAAIRLAYDRKSVPFAQAAARYAEEMRRPGTGAGDAALAGKLAGFFEKLARWRSWTRTRALHEALGEMYAASHIVAYLSGLDGGLQRVANVQMLHQRALQFAGFRKQGLHRFLRFIERLQEQEGDFGEAPVLSEASDVVRIMSIHKSKGLEFPVVFVSGLGGGFNLAGDSRTGGAAMGIHRDLHIGLKYADRGRDALFATAASLAIVEVQRRGARAEELRLLYVALTRARDHLVLTGTMRRAGVIEEVRAGWKGGGGVVPEDVLLGGGRFLDWILPALAMGDGGALRVQWAGERVSGAQVRVELHAAGAERAVVAGAGGARGAAGDDAAIGDLVAGRPLGGAAGAAGAAGSDTLALRITGEYPHAAFAQQPAVMTVTELKKRAEGRGDDEEIGGAALPGAKRSPLSAGDDMAARARGIATHRLLEEMDFGRVGDAAGVEGEIGRLVAARKLSKEQGEAIDREAVRWFLGTELGRELAEAARERAEDVRREIPFVWICPDAGPPGAGGSGDARDWPTIRGVIDVLMLAAPRAASAKGRGRIIDYKTDSLRTWQAHLPEYRKQMEYYLRAAGDILGTPVEEATLVFLAARRMEEVRL